MDVVTAVVIAGIQTQRAKLKRVAKRYGRLSANAFKRGDYEKFLIHGAKAAAALTADHILAQQQENLRRQSR